MTQIVLSPWLRAFLSTQRVWACGPPTASVSSSTPSTIFITRSTSAPKSACPGVSTILMVYVLLSLGLVHLIAVFFALMVIPFSLSRSIESIIRSSVDWFSLKVPLCFSRQSTRVVLPWSTWAIIAMFLIKSAFIKSFLWFYS